MTKRLVTTAAMIALTAGFAFAQPTAKPATNAQPAKAPTAATPAKTEAKAEPALKVGSDAPAIASIDKWEKGTEVKTFATGKVYVVEFWATWCGPCKASIPHLTEMAHKFKDVTFIGVAASEHKGKDGKDTREADLAKFVKDEGTKMDYTVAYNADGSMGKNWLQAAGQNGIPCAFIVDGQGKLAYIGHPMEEGFESTLSKLAKTSTTAKPADSKKTDSGKTDGKK